MQFNLYENLNYFLDFKLSKKKVLFNYIEI